MKMVFAVIVAVEVVSCTRATIICLIRGILIQIFSVLVLIGFHMINEQKVMKKLNNSKKSLKVGRLVLKTQKVQFYLWTNLGWTIFGQI